METVNQAIATVAAAVKPAAPPHESPVGPDSWLRADAVEEIKPDEDKKAEEIGELIRKMQTRNFDQHQHMYRGTHVSIVQERD
jgi:hypothetical protein